MLILNSQRILESLKKSEGFAQFKGIADQYPLLDFYVAGGAIRNLFYYEKKYSVKDIDVFVQGEGFDAFKNEIVQQRKHGVTPFGSLRWWPSSEMSFDIIHFNEMAVLNTKPRSIIELLSQFDFTINSLALNIRTHEFYDPLNGLTHIRQKIIKAVRFDFKDDFISGSCPISPQSTLWFRLQHYAIKLGFALEPETAEWITRNKFRLKYLTVFKKCFFDPFLQDSNISK